MTTITITENNLTRYDQHERTIFRAAADVGIVGGIGKLDAAGHPARREAIAGAVDAHRKRIPAELRIGMKARAKGLPERLHKLCAWLVAEGPASEAPTPTIDDLDARPVVKPESVLPTATTPTVPAPAPEDPEHYLFVRFHVRTPNVDAVTHELEELVADGTLAEALMTACGWKGVSALVIGVEQGASEPAGKPPTDPTPTPEPTPPKAKRTKRAAKIAKVAAPLPFDTVGAECDADADMDTPVNEPELRQAPTEADVWVTGADSPMPDATGTEQYLHLVRAKGDPQRTPREALAPAERGEAQIVKTKQRVNKPIEALRADILGLLADGIPRTFNAIGVTLYDRTADVLATTPVEPALFSLVTDGLLEHTMGVPVFFRLTQKPATPEVPAKSGSTYTIGAPVDVGNWFGLPSALEVRLRDQAGEGYVVVLTQRESSCLVTTVGDVYPDAKAATKVLRGFARTLKRGGAAANKLLSSAARA